MLFSSCMEEWQPSCDHEVTSIRRNRKYERHMDLKNIHNQEVESYVLFGGDFYHLSLTRRCISSDTENCSEEVGGWGGGARFYRRLAQKAGSPNIKRLLFIIETQIAQVK